MRFVNKKKLEGFFIFFVSIKPLKLSNKKIGHSLLVSFLIIFFYVTLTHLKRKAFLENNEALFDFT